MNSNPLNFHKKKTKFSEHAWCKIRSKDGTEMLTGVCTIPQIKRLSVVIPICSYVNYLMKSANIMYSSWETLTIHALIRNHK